MAKNTGLSSLEPKLVWQSFEELTKIPRPSKKEEKVLEFLKNWAKKNNLQFKQDEAGNLVIKKPATKGMENRIPVALQGHVDMVCEKNSDVEFDFDNDPIQAYVDGDFVKAKGTTLGADNGIGVAMGMAVMLSDNVAHPPLELLLTVDEETGLTGANRLATDMLDAKILMNIDSEEEDAFTIGCAGGVNTIGKYIYVADKVPDESATYKISVKGLMGGHSGINIHEGRGNAIALLTRIVWKLVNKMNARIVSIDAPGKHNAIPREAFAVVMVKNAALKDFKNYVDECIERMGREYKTKEPDLKIEYKEVEKPSRVMEINAAKKFINSLLVIPHGVFRMSPDIPGLVQTSTNLAVVITSEKEITVLTSQRSSLESEKQHLANKVRASMELGGAEVESSDGYPSWEPNVNSQILHVSEEVYKKVFGKAPQIVAIHAGLECGLVGEKYPGMDMISFGPNLFDVHTPSEKVQISSVQKIWNFLIELLKNVPVKK
ncbi:MAG: aminoacyl-histidine dipeptidase [Candidatus Kapaibacteriota bacterium]